MRHGQTIYQKENRNINYDPKENPFITLTDEGKKMVEESAEILKDKNIDLIFSSPYIRAKQSVEIVAKIIGIEEINFDERLVDINLGKFMGRSMEESWKFYIDGTNSFDNRPEGGESWNDILLRTKIFIGEVEEKYSGKNILIVSHADPIWLMLGYLRGLKLNEQFLESRNDKKNSYPKLAQLIKA
jgi:broad specificity phosphatase PhoE